MQSDLLDDDPHRRLRVAQAEHAAPSPEAAGQSGQIEHQRGVTERQLGEIDYHVPLGADRPGERGASVSLGRTVLIASTTQYPAGVIELDDAGNLHNGSRGRKRQSTVFRCSVQMD